jgi:hypothetical protein
MAVSIQTRYIGPTNHQPGRVVAEVMVRRSVDGGSAPRERKTIRWDSSATVWGNHRAACVALLGVLASDYRSTREQPSAGIWGRVAQWISGETDAGYVWVYTTRKPTQHDPTT